NLGAGTLIADGERLLDRPVVLNGSARRNDGPQRGLQPRPVFRSLAYLDIRRQAEKRAAPVCAAPGVGAVKAFIAGLRLALRHVAHHVAPDPGWGQLTGLHASHGLDVSGDPLFNPMVIAGDV